MTHVNIPRFGHRLLEAVNVLDVGARSSSLRFTRRRPPIEKDRVAVRRSTEPGNTGPMAVPRRGRAESSRCLMALVAFAFSMSSAACGRASSSDTPCADRSAFVSLSSSERNPRLLESAVELVGVAAASAVVCGKPFNAYAVAGAGQVRTIVTADELAAMTPQGSLEARRQRFNAAKRTRLTGQIHDRLNDAVSSMPTTTSAIEAIYAAAAEHSTMGTSVIILSDFVEETTTINLNRPLSRGDGTVAAASISVPKLGSDVSVVGVGVAQLDGSASPDPAWNAEIQRFAITVCERSGATCRMYSTAPASEVLATRPARSNQQP